MRALLVLGLVACNGGDDGTPSDGSVADDTAPEECTLPLTCAEAVQLECTGSLTPAELADPTGCPDIAVSDDAPADGFPVGATTVIFADATYDATCTVDLTVTDTVAPMVACEAAVTLVSADGSAVAAPAALGVEDTCWNDLTAPPTPATLDVGVTDVVYYATDGAGNVGSCTTQVAVLDGRPPSGLHLLSASSVSEKTWVTLAFDPTPGADVTSMRLEAGGTAEGPWTTVDLLLPHEIWVDDVVLELPQVWFRLVSVTDGGDGGASDPLLVHSVVQDGYDIDGVDVPGLPFDTTLYGVVRHPADLSAGPYPLVILLHGNHGNCRVIGTTNDYCATLTTHECPYDGYEPTPNAEGMAFQAETLAAQGYVAVSISGNAVNCRSDYIFERSALILEHLRTWQDWNAQPGGVYQGAVDLDRVGLIGHSRGGEAVAHVPSLLLDNPIEGLAVRSVFSIAPVDFHGAEVEGTPFGVVLPACDGDVSTLNGRDIYDRSVHPSHEVVRSQAFTIGSNHNFYSTEWTFDDSIYACPSEARIGGLPQRVWLESVIGPWFNATLKGAALPAILEAEGRTPPAVELRAARELDVRWSHAAATRLVIDDFTGPGAPDTNLLALLNAYSGFSSVSACAPYTCGSAFDHAKSAVTLTWDNGAATAATFTLGGLDASGAAALSFRVVSRRSTANEGRTAQDLLVVVVDGDGDEAVVPLADLTVVPHLYLADDVREILQTVRVPLERVVEANPAVDLAALAALTIELGVDGFGGSVHVTDVELAY